MPQLNKNKAYQKLVEKLKTLLTPLARTGTQALNEDKLLTYWSVGKNLHALTEMDNEVFLKELAKDTQVQPLFLYRTRVFYRDYPRGLSANAKRLTWAHHIELMPLREARMREFYLEQTLARGWDRDSLRHAIRTDFYATAATNPKAAQRLTRTADLLYLYKAQILEVIDGDTLLAHVDLGFHTLTLQRLRLRGLNTAELDKPNQPSAEGGRALRAKAYVQDKLQDIPFVVIKTYQTDIYGRYLADVFYHPSLTNKEDVARDGMFLNDELLKEGLARPWGI